MKIIFKILNFFKIINSKRIKKLAKKKFILEKNEFLERIKREKFTTKWFLNNFDVFNYFLPKDKNKSFNYLEIGSYEGLSLFNVLYFYKNCFATAIDIWAEPNFNSENINLDLVKAESNFDQNIKSFKNFEKKKGDSVIRLRELVLKKIFYDFIYIDGSHNGEDVLSDAIESFKILKKDGIIVFDDAMASVDNEKKYQTYHGVITFLKMFKKEVKILYIKNIIVIKKIT